MRGPHDAALRLVEHHHRHLGAELRAVETEAGMAVGELGAPKLIEASDPGQIGAEWHPAVLVSVLSTTGQVLDDVQVFGSTTPGGDPVGPHMVFEVTYRVRHEVVLSAPDLPTADRWRYAWLTAIRASLLANPALDDEHADAAPARIDRGFVESYDAPASDGTRGYAQGLLEHTLAVTETLTGPAGVAVDGIAARGYAVPTDAPLDVAGAPGSPRGARVHPSD